MGTDIGAALASGERHDIPDLHGTPEDYAGLLDDEVIRHREKSEGE